MSTIIARSIAAKIALAFSFVVVTLIASYVVMGKRLDAIAVAMENVTEISNYSTSVIRINKDIIEMQRDVSVYSLSGSDAVYEKIKENFHNIQQRLNTFPDANLSTEERRYIKELTQLVAKMGINLSALSPLYKSREEMIDRVLEGIYQSAILELEILVDNASTAESQLKIVEESNDWHTLHRSAWLFLTKKDYSKKQKVSALIRQLSLSNLEVDADATLRLQNLVHEYQTSFAKSVQINRNYLNLANVVMAGDANEFGILANQLRELSQKRLQTIKEEGFDSILTTENLLNILSISIVFYLFFLVLFFHVHITQAIVQLTHSFSRFLVGDLSAPINHANRRDEIGVLAQAASRFRDVSKDLEKEKKAAEHTSKVKSEFLANMSHEIRTPMNGILGMTSQLLETNLTVKQKDMLNIISSSGQSLLVIINDILDLSKIEADRIEFENQPIDLSLLCKDLEFLFKGQTTTKGIDFSVQILPEDERGVFLGDETRIKQILMNLLGNAIKFTDNGGVTLLVQVTTNEDDKLRLSFAVSDSGIGIDQANLNTLFEAFTQADTSITRKFGGTGLGLTITTKLLNLMGTELKVESEVGKGSKFYFEIHADKGWIEPAAILEAASSEQREKVDFSSLNILVAEDNKTNQVVIKGFLKKLNVGTVVVAEDGEQALKLCEKFAFDLIFMDMQMPVKDGLQATLEIKQLENYHNVPIVALTANVFDEDKVRCAEAGMCDFLSKPVNVQDLEHTLTTWTSPS